MRVHKGAVSRRFAAIGDVVLGAEHFGAEARIGRIARGATIADRVRRIHGAGADVHPLVSDDGLAAAAGDWGRGSSVSDERRIASGTIAFLLSQLDDAEPPLV